MRGGLAQSATNADLCKRALREAGRPAYPPLMKVHFAFGSRLFWSCLMRFCFHKSQLLPILKLVDFFIQPHISAFSTSPIYISPVNLKLSMT